MEEKKIGFWVTVGAIGLMVIGTIVMIISGGKLDSLFKKAFELLGKSKAKDEDRKEEGKKADEQIKENEEDKKKAEEIVSETKKDTEKLKEKIEENQNGTAVERMKEQIRKNKKMLEEK